MAESSGGKMESLKCDAHQTSGQQPPSQVDEPSPDSHSTTQPSPQNNQPFSDPHTSIKPSSQNDQPFSDPHTTTQPSPQVDQPSFDPHTAAQPSPQVDQPSLGPHINTQSSSQNGQPSPDPHNTSTQPSLQVDQPSDPHTTTQPSQLVDQPIPQVDQPSPQVDQPSPQADQPSPQVDQPSSDPHATAQPSQLVDQPIAQVDQPSLQVDQPSSDPHTTTSQPSPQVDQPFPQVDQPSTQIDQPVDQPSPQVVQPSPQVNQPSPQVDQPSPQVDQLSPQVDLPSSDPQPSPQDDQPSSDPCIRHTSGGIAQSSESVLMTDSTLQVSSAGKRPPDAPSSSNKRSKMEEGAVGEKIISADYGGAVFRSQILQPSTCFQTAVSAPCSPTISHLPSTGSSPTSAGSAANMPGSESVPNFQDSHSAAESNPSTCTQSATDEVPVENRKRRPPLTLQGSNDGGSSCNECAFKKHCSEPNKVASCTTPVKSKCDVSKEKTSQPPLDVSSLNSSQSDTCAVPSSHLLHVDVSSDEESSGSYHSAACTPPSPRSPQSSLSAALGTSNYPVQPEIESQRATSSTADVESIVNSGSSNATCESDIDNPIPESDKSSSATQDNCDQKIQNLNVVSTVNSDNLSLETTSDPQSMQDKSKSTSATQENGSASLVNVTSISQQDGNNKPDTEINPSVTKQEASLSVANVTVISQQERNEKPDTNNPGETKQDSSSCNSNIVANSQQVSNNKPGIYSGTAEGGDDPESHTPTSDHISSGTSGSSAMEDKNTEDNSSPHLSSMFSAFQPPHDKAISIYFKAILSKKAWDSDKNRVFISLMHFNVIIGPGSSRRVDDDLHLVEFVVNMHIDVFSSCDYIFYKYCLTSHRTKEIKYSYEYLHGARIKGIADAGLIYRALKIDQSKCKPGANIHQFDTMIYPEPIKSSGITGWVSGLLDSTSKVPAPLKMRKLCMSVYLQQYKRILLGGEFVHQEDFDISNAVTSINDLFVCCGDQYCGTSDADVDCWSLLTALNKEIKSWLQNVIHDLDLSALPPQPKLVAATVLMCCAHYMHMHKPVNEKTNVALLKMLALQSNGESFKFLTSFMKQKYSQHLMIESLTDVIKLVVDLKEESYTNHLLKALPLLHLLRGNCTPFQECVVRPSVIKWNDHYIDFTTTQQVISSKKGFVKKCYEVVKDLFFLDPLLVFNVAYICPSSDVAELCKHLHLPYAISLVSMKIQNFKKQVSEAKEAVEVDDVICKPLSVIQQRDEEVLSFDINQLEHCIEAAHLVALAVEEKVAGTSKNEQKLIKSSVALMLFLLGKLDNFHSSQDSSITKLAGEMKICGLQKIHQCLSQWLQRGRHTVDDSYSGILSYSRQELKVWHFLLELRCYPSVEQDWQKIVKEIVAYFVKTLPCGICVRLFLELEGNPATSPLLIDTFMTEATTALEELVLEKQVQLRNSGDGNKYIFDTFSKTKSARVVKLLGILLMRKYSEFHENRVPLADLLDWELWPTYITIYAREAGVTKKESKKAWEPICKCALDVLQDLHTRIDSGEISVRELHEVYSKKDQMHKLYSATVVDGKQRVDLPSANTMDTNMDQRFKEYQEFQKYQQRLSHILIFLKPESLPEAASLSAYLSTNFDDRNINKLCFTADQKIEVCCFPEAPPMELMEQFWIMTQECKNMLFINLWNESFTTITSQSVLRDAVEEMWSIVFGQCVDLLNRLENYSLSLMTVDKLFKGNSLPVITNHITQLCRGVEWCQNGSDCTNDFKWIYGVVERMSHFWQLCEFADAARVFLEVRDALNLTGDFQLVDNVASQAANSMKDKTLLSIDQSVVTAAKFLQDFASDERKRDCLRAYVESKKIVNWISEEIKDVNDLQNFVNISLATAAGGEGDLARDKLSNLRTVGSGFGALIYKLPPDAGYETLVDRCKSLWGTLKSTPKLPNMMRECNKAIDWYKSVKETQGSVEVTSYGQMKNIHQYGSYTIGSTKRGVYTSQSQVIRLELNSEESLPKNVYSLDDLCDLESKLVLITSRESSEDSEVQDFLQSLECVRRIADALIALQQHGSGDYVGWQMWFPCNLPNVVERLQQEASKLEADLEQWKHEIQEQREQFYELNYYTTKQLLLLREELGRLQEPGENVVKPEAMALLHSISRNITDNEVKMCVLNVVTTKDDVREDADDNLESTHESAAPNFTSPSSSSAIVADVHVVKSESSKCSTPQAKQKQDDLSPVQKAILLDIMENFEYDKKLILLAFDHCDNPNDHNTVVTWCIDNGGVYVHSEDEEEEEEEEEEEVEESHVKGELIEQERTPHDKGNFKEDAAGVVPGSDQLEMETTKEHGTVDIDRVVKDLLKLDYSLKECLQAAQRYPNDSHAAHLYLLQNHGQSDVFGTVDENENDAIAFRQPDVEDHVATFVSVGGLTISSDETKVFLTLQMLGSVLHNMSCEYTGPVQCKRTLPPTFSMLKVGEPNLLVTPTNDVLKTTLALYMEDGEQTLPMPTYEEVLVCSEQTTDEEVILLWRRALGDPKHFRLFSLVYAEQLSYQVCDRALWYLSQLSQGQKDYRIVIICSNEEESKSHIISKLHFCQRQYFNLPSDATFAEYLIRHFRRWPEDMRLQKGLSSPAVASVVDPDKSYVRVVTSQRAGMGKSLYIKRRMEALHELVTTDGPHEVIVPIHGPSVTPNTLVGALKEHMGINYPIIFHFDIAPSVLWQVNSILFCLLVLQGVCDSHGHVWRCHPAHLYMIESTIPKGGERKAASHTIAFYKLLPSVECVSPRQLLILPNLQVDTTASCVLMDEDMFRSHTYQRVFQYMHRHNATMDLDHFTYQPWTVVRNKADFLDIMLPECGVKDPSWMELNHFLRFLDFQLGACENSLFCDEKIVGEAMSGLKTFVIKFMIRMSKDFATSSLRGEVAIENKEHEVAIENEEHNDMDMLEEYTIAERKEWEKSYHPYLFFNCDRLSITFVGFNANSDSELVDPVMNIPIEGLEGVLSHQLHDDLKRNEVNLSENYLQWDKETMMQKMSLVMGLENLSDPDPSYVLTVDNMIKILAIQMRFRCKIPVVVMGETGCGKTRLIRFMCDMIAVSAGGGRDCVKNMLIMKVHGGTTIQDVVQKVKEAEELAEENSQKQIDTVLFFDEANTTEAIELIKEVMCDQRVQGRKISQNVNFIAACNPYRRHTDEMIKKLESAGLGFYIKATETQQKLGKIPLRQLVYRVFELPPSMRPLVYDFGQLTDTTEQDYIGQIVHNYCSETLSKQDIITALTRVLTWCQKYMRERKDECSFVSLRDVERAMIVFKFFTEKKDLFSEHIVCKAAKEDGSKTHLQDGCTWSLVMSLSVCYHARLQDRADFEKGVVQLFTSPIALPGGVQQFTNEIKWCQEVLLENMVLGQNIARNAALRENVFMMTIAIELRIPLFIVGKPGSSKSLAKSIVADSMHGRASENDLMKAFKEVHMFSYQCSQLSTPESVIEVFNTAKSFQEKQDTSKFVSVVVLDEVGLAEDSPNMPLKALHPLLEDGTEGADNSKQIVDREKRVAFIGISNWALDPAKMNRGVMVTRDDPDRTELELSARGICSNAENDPVKDRLNRFFAPLAEAYIDICKMQERQFYGLRDFYSLVKMLYWMCERSNSDPTSDQLEHAIKRNFGGHEKVQAYEIFSSRITQLIDRSLCHDDASEELKSILHPDCTPLGLIRTSLKTKETTWHGENRYLLFLTENYSALQVLKRYLQVVLSHSASVASGPERRKMVPFVLFGSSFRKDKEYTQVCRNINQIKICMETGRTVVLLNLENLYESLYDLLNQYYIMLGDKRYVDLGLQTHRVKCRVHEDFKLILIAEKDTVYEKFPMPLINRLEKHFVFSRTVLLSWQKTVLDDLIIWVEQFSRCCTSTGSFTEQDSFVGYQNDTPASVVFQATEQLREEQRGEVNEEMEETEEWKDQVLDRSKSLLVQMASPDALIRLQRTKLDAEERKSITVTYAKQHHDSLKDFLGHHLKRPLQVDDDECMGLLLHVTTHSHLLSSIELENLRDDLGFSTEHLKWFLLQGFETEMDFSNKVKLMFERQNDPKNDQTESLLIIQCDLGHLYGDLIACARYRVDDERERSSFRWTHGHGRTHILFIVHLPRGGGDTGGASNVRLGSFVAFQGGRWLSAHIDDLRTPSEAVLCLDDALHTSISDLFYCNRTAPVSGTTIQADKGEERKGMSEKHGTRKEEQTEEGKEDSNVKLSRSMVAYTPKASYQCSRLYNCIQAAVARADNSKKFAERRIKTLLDLIPQQPNFPIVGMESFTLLSDDDDLLFYAALVRHIHSVLCEREEVIKEYDEWVVSEAMSGKRLQNGGPFRNVLSRKLDEVIIPIFAEILVHVDRYCNLDLVTRKHAPSHVRSLWLTVFTCCELCSFSYTEVSVHEDDGLAGIRKRKSIDNEFQCQFPFFWLIKETLDAHWNTVITATDGHEQQIHQNLCKHLAASQIGKLLDRVGKEEDKENCGDLYRRYLCDYIRCVHWVTRSQSSAEYKLIEEALDTIISSYDLSPHTSNHAPLLCHVAAVHLAYHNCQGELLSFGRLTAQLPGVVVKLEEVKHNPDKLELHLRAVKVVLDDNLTPPLNLKDRKHLSKWLVWMQLCQNAVESITTLGKDTNELTAAVYYKWQHLRAVQMFVEHLISKHDELEVYGKRLDFCLSNMSDFTKDATICSVKKILQTMEEDLKTKKKLDKQKRLSIRDSCHAFFMELVSTLCFGQQDLPEPKLIEHLMSIVFEGDNSTKDFTYSKKTESDKQPVIRSFLLQLLLEHDIEHVRAHLEVHFKRSCGHDDVGINQISLLYIQCFEDALFKQQSQLTLQQKVCSSLQLLRDGREKMAEHHVSHTSLSYLEAVAKLRCSLSVVAELLHTQQTVECWQYTNDDEFILLINEVKNFCSHFQLKENEAGPWPAVYLVKLLMRQYGPSFLYSMCKNTDFLWVVPEHLRPIDEENQRIDRFVIYDPLYPKLRNVLVDAAHGEQIEELASSCQNLTLNESVPLLLAVYEVVTQSHLYHQPSKQISDEMVANISSFIKCLPMLNKELMGIAETLINNTQGRQLEALRCQPDQTLHNVLLSGVVVHTAVTILTRSRLHIMQPLFKMMENPGDLKQLFLPTMPQDTLPKAESPKGHLYLTSESGSCIGGMNHTTIRSDSEVHVARWTKKGYVLGSANQREALPIHERSLSPAACAIIRAMMHSALLWASCNNENAVQGLISLTHGTVKQVELAQFFWRHFEHDITILGKAVGKSEDDVCMLLHLILKNMATKSPAESISDMPLYFSLLTASAREEWENCFEQEYIQPVLLSLDKQISDTMQLILSEKKEEQDQLLYTSYEKSSLISSSSSNLPHLWTYHSRITLEHLYQTLLSQKMKDKCPILVEFLKAEPILRATRYIPELVQLQKQMFKFSYYQLDRKKDPQLSVREYIKSLKSEHEKIQFRNELKCVSSAWELVKGKLSNYTQMLVPQDCFDVTMSEELKLEWLIPTFTGPGVVTVAMLDMLVEAHNDFIEMSQAIVKKGQKETNLTWITQKIPVTHVQLCHLLDYEHQLLSIVLSHCQYSLTYGHGQDIIYDLPALQKHIVGRFIHGKPLLILDNSYVLYQKNVHTAASFANIRKKVSPQIKLSLREQQNIVTELQTKQNIRDCLDVVEIVMGFLASGGQKGKTRLSHYLATALKMKHRFFSRKALEYCSLGHVLSLWETLSVELARLLTLSNKEPFDFLHANHLADLGDKEEELDRLLPKLDVHLLLCTLYEFIETSIRHRDSGDHDALLVDTLKAHLDQYGIDLPQLTDDLLHLPADLTIGQAVSTWKYIVLYQHKKTNVSKQVY